MIDKYYYLIDDYRRYREIDDLEEAIRTEPDIFKSQLIRDFVADIVSGKEKPPKKFINRSIEERNEEICDRIIELCAMGIPIMKSTDYEHITCCGIAADEFGLGATTVYKDIWSKRLGRKRLGDLFYSPLYLGNMFVIREGLRYYVLNDYGAPKSMDEIQKLTEKLCQLSTMAKIEESNELWRKVDIEHEKLQELIEKKWLETQKKNSINDPGKLEFLEHFFQ